MSYIETLNMGQRTARKAHQCYDCYRMIQKGELHQFGTFKYDDVYTIRHHVDCYAASAFYIKFHDMRPYEMYDGIQPLKDMISDGGESAIDYGMLRGRFPHVVCRMELGDHLSEIAWQKKIDVDLKEPKA